MSSLELTLLGSAAILSTGIVVGAHVVAGGVSRSLGRLALSLADFQTFLEDTIHEFARQQTEARDEAERAENAEADEMHRDADRADAIGAETVAAENALEAPGNRAGRVRHAGPGESPGANSREAA